MKTPTEQLLEMGFAHMPMKEHFGDNPPERFHYLYRKFENNHQYVSLMYDYVTLDSYTNLSSFGNFLEAVFEAYWSKKDTRSRGSLPAQQMEKKGWKPVHCTIYRNIKELTEAASKEYQLSPEEKKKS